jgi:hypothetical protein
MNRKKILQRIDLLEKQLTILMLYEQEFMKKLGSKGIEDFINLRLEELSNLYKLINNE